VIIVDKIAEKLMLYHAGKQINSYQAELGQNWVGDKNFEGDKSTPEGAYFVTSKKQGRQTKYYKALGINYPNVLDKKRFSEQKSNGTIKASGTIGGLIEIHGDGGKGYHWTDGCIALKNEDMDEVFRLVDVKTSVIIVGSLRPLEEIIKI
jgi:murein L,D-transpeptidase YafK